MGKDDSLSKGSKYTMGAFLQLEAPDPATPRTHPPESLLSRENAKPRGKKETPSPGRITQSSEYANEWPTPAEVRARHFKGLCLECQMIFATWGPPNGGYNIRHHERRDAHHSFRDLEYCWCPLCKMLLRELGRYDEGSVRALRSAIRCTARSHVRVYEHLREVPCHYVELEFDAGERVLRPAFRMFISGQTSNTAVGPIHSSTDCQPVWDIANEWLRTCRDSHGYCCTTYLDKMLPTRLIQVGGNNSELRLVLSSSLSADAEYATLSHCWGTKPFLKLTQANLHTLLRGIQYESLSKTFQDAVVAARNLGLSYLWIDSLCIVQEDWEDWQHEAVKMSHIYSNSSLNLAASDSPDGHTGCFFEDRPDVPNVWKVSFPPTGTTPKTKMSSFADDEDIPDKVYLWNCITPGTRRVIEESLLASRAWTLQERLLPPRTLYFGREQIAWECRTCTAYEGLPDMFDEGIMGLSPENFVWTLEEDEPLSHTYNVQLWSDIVEDYSKRKLTFDKDRLVAISGLARILASVYGTEYVAGMWVKDLIRLLIWHKDVSEPLSSRDSQAAYRAPSWSWASVGGGVKFPKGYARPLDGDRAAIDAIHASRLYPASVLEAVTAYPEDQFGEVTSGYIRIRVQTLFRVTVDTAKWLHHQQFPVDIRGLGVMKEFTAYPDFDLESIGGKSLLIPVAEGLRSYPYDYPELRGLFLERVEDGVYRRKGAWRIGGQYSQQGFEEITKVTRACCAKGKERLALRSELGLDDEEFASLWDGEVYIVKII
ncbi:HET-domain-containing protein [Bimuria novae-zelandiae CBS 107.79]|uniref:HET-domain-containing protein n=1 Tax=Bimuria novae-zelandiae CBS 107.79 TaxID=1447943 RepID=A0A6A5V1P8_9PLEO|nr:HET-domain-containing protein [Bimuria novae-zelandiae CBS 107.79]